MSKLILALSLAALSFAAAYRTDTMKLGTAYRAKLLCSCLFVSKLPESYCREWSAPPILSGAFVYKVDEPARSVSAGFGFLNMKGSIAAHRDDRRGCVLER